MREIKFRGWDINNKRWIVPGWADDVYQEELFIDFNGKIRKLNYDSLDFVDGIIYQQYLGINDNVGKEMCEGDIVEWGMGPMYQIVWDKTYAKFKFTTITNQDGMYILPEGEIRKSKVCGNIFETPHYLEISF